MQPALMAGWLAAATYDSAAALAATTCVTEGVISGDLLDPAKSGNRLLALSR